MRRLPGYLPEWNPDAPITSDEADILALLCARPPGNDFSQIHATESSLLQRVIRLQNSTSQEQLDSEPFQLIPDFLLPGDPPIEWGRIRSAFDRMARCIAALTHPPEILTEANGQLISTRFGPGFAPLTTITGHPDQQLMAIHTDRATHFLQRLHQTRHALLQVLQWAISLGTQPLNWIRFGMQLIQQFRQFEPRPGAPEQQST